ncbi:MAG TPA: NAD(P)-dependent oxidoreductase [Thermodesulfobacteriota bacterium]
MTSESVEKRRVGFLGLGAMGAPMARRLLERGVPLRVFDPNPAATRPFTERGIEAAATPRALGAWANVLVCMLPHPDVLREVILGEEGAIHSLAAGSVVVDMSTNGPAVVKACGARLAEKGVGMVDAPVGKGPWAAEKGDLTILMGGDRETCRSVEPILKMMGSTVYYCGPLGSGQVIKLANNLVSCANIAVVAEAYALARQAGADLGVLAEVMPQTSADSWQLRNTFVKKVLNHDFSPMFKLKLAHKDMRLILQMAEDLGAAAGCARGALDWYARADAAGHGELDWGAVLLVADPTLEKA